MNTAGNSDRRQELKSEYDKNVESQKHLNSTDRFLFHLEVFGRGSSVTTYLAKCSLDTEKLTAQDGFYQLLISSEYLKKEGIPHSDSPVDSLFAACIGIVDLISSSPKNITVERLELLSLGAVFLDKAVRKEDLSEATLKQLINNCLGGWTSGSVPESANACAKRLGVLNT